LVAEGFTYGRKNKRLDYVNQHKEGLWVYYDENGIPIDSTIYVRNYALGNYITNDNKGHSFHYSIKRSGISTISYFDYKNKLYRKESFDLSLDKIIKTVTHYNIKGDITSIEKWYRGKMIESIPIEE
jgi:hypothetical protein